MNTVDTEILQVETKREKGLARLIENSHSDPMSLSVSLDWCLGVNRSLPPKLPEQCWIYGTPWYETLTDEQRHELLWLEIARDVSMFISLEQTIPVLYVGYLNQPERKFRPEIYEYLMIFSKEEIVHTLVFKRYMKLAGLEQYPSEGSVDVAMKELRDAHPVAGILFTLIIEWVAELGVMYSTQHDGVDPLTRQLFHRHHIDEARHIAFARWIVESHFATASDEAVAQLRDMARRQVERMVPAFSFIPHVGDYTSFKFPIGPDDEQAIEAVLNSPANVALNKKRFAPLYSWLKKLDIL